MWRCERDEADDHTHYKIASPKTMIIVFWEMNGFHVIELLSDAYRFGLQNEWNLIFQILILNQSMPGFRANSKYSRRSIHIHMNNGQCQSFHSHALVFDTKLGWHVSEQMPPRPYAADLSSSASLSFRGLNTSARDYAVNISLSSDQGFRRMNWTASSMD
jgi:hypothetical protein